MRIHPNNTFRPGDYVMFKGGPDEYVLTVLHVNGRGVLIRSDISGYNAWVRYTDLVQVCNTSPEISEEDYLELMEGLI